MATNLLPYPKPLEKWNDTVCVVYAKGSSNSAKLDRGFLSQPRPPKEAGTSVPLAIFKDTKLEQGFPHEPDARLKRRGPTQTVKPMPLQRRALPKLKPNDTSTNVHPPTRSLHVGTKGGVPEGPGAGSKDVEAVASGGGLMARSCRTALRASSKTPDSDLLHSLPSPPRPARPATPPPLRRSTPRPGLLQHTFLCAGMHVCECACVRVRMCTCTYARVIACVRLGVYVQHRRTGRGREGWGGGVWAREERARQRSSNRLNHLHRKLLPSNT